MPDWDPDYYAQWGLPGHNGIDYGCLAGTLGGASLSCRIDKVAFEAGGFGQYVRGDCGDFWHYYCHLTRNGVLANVGDRIKQGQKFYRTGYTGAVWPKGELGAHLHFAKRLKTYPNSDIWKGWRDPFTADIVIPPPPPLVTEFAGAVVIPLSGVEYKVITDYVNKRSGPGTDRRGYQVIGRLEGGQVVAPSRIIAYDAWLDLGDGYCALVYQEVIYLVRVE
jgi:hypothetical protein